MKKEPEGRGVHRGGLLVVFFAEAVLVRVSAGGLVAIVVSLLDRTAAAHMKGAAVTGGVEGQ
jgi:hypothetical protein